MPGPTIDVVVPVYGNWHETESCLAALRTQTVTHRVIVVDDASPDDTLTHLRADFPEVDVVALDRNSGFATACNSGIRAGSGDIVVLVNNDVQAEPDMLARLVPAFADPRVGSAAPLLFRPNGTVDGYGICADPTLAGFVRCAGEPEASVNREDLPALLGPYGAVAAYRRVALDEVGLLDQGIFMYGEELDLALRLSAGGWTCVAEPTSRGVHLGGATAKRGSKSQRRRAGFGRGYLLRAYGVLRSRYGFRALVTEAAVCLADLVSSRDLAAATGRFEGWRAGRSTARRASVIPGIDRTIGFSRSLRMRVADRGAE